MFDKHILPHFGQLKMTELTRPELQAWVNELSAPNTLSKSTIEDIKNHLKTRLEQAVLDDFFMKNPARRLTVTGLPKKTIYVT